MVVEDLDLSQREDALCAGQFDAKEAGAGRFGLGRADGELKFVQDRFAGLRGAAGSLLRQTFVRQQFEANRGEVGYVGARFDGVSVRLG